MANRGRPRYPDVLTPREWEVLELLREGLTNEQIAERLGVAERTAKYHVSEILGKLGVGSREEAAAWEPEARRPWWAAAIAALGWPVWAKGAGVGVVAASAAGVGVLVWGVVATGGPGEENPPLVAAPGAHAGPRIGVDHWHATYQIFACGERRPNFPVWESGVHTHGDGVIHIHPFVPSEEGDGARLVKFFEYGGGLLSQTEMRLPGSDKTLSNGDKCPDGSEAALQVYLNGQPLEDWNGYIPQDGDRVRIVFGPPETSSPAPVPDAGLGHSPAPATLLPIRANPRLAFGCPTAQAPEGETGIFVLDLTNCTVHRLTDGRSDGNHAWSPDGTRLAFQRLDQPDPRANSDLFIMQADGTGLTQLTDTSDQQELLPRWSPDGSAIAFYGLALEEIKFTPEQGLNQQEWTYDLMVLDLGEGGELRTIADDLTSIDYGYAWSPDGHELTMVHPGDGGYALTSINVSTGARRVLATDALPYPRAWSPAGGRIAYTCGTALGSPDRRGVCIVDAEGAQHVRLTDPAAATGDPSERAPAGGAPVWTPDGRQVVFSNAVTLYFVDPSDGQVLSYLEHWAAADSPGWTGAGWVADGIAAAARCSVNNVIPCPMEVFVIDLSTSESHAVVKEQVCGISSRWSADVTKVAFAVGSFGYGCL